MAQSYVPQGTTVICTMMTNSSPQKLGISRAATIVHKAKGQPLLNINDKKLSGPFGCKNPAKFWGGLQALCLGIALAAAVVLTGGAALVVIVAACAVGAVSGVAALYKMAHDCDIIETSTWLFPHDTVRIDKAKALLNGSNISCTKGGLVNIIMDPVIAQDAAEQISNNNAKEVLAQMGSQFLVGAISIIAALPAGVVGITTAAILATPMYWFGEEKPITEAINPELKDKSYIGSAAENVTGVVAVTVLPGSGGVVIGYAVNTVGRATGSFATQLEGGIIAAVSKGKLIKDIKPSPAMGWGLLGAIANFVINEESDRQENELAVETEYLSKEFNNDDASNGISVIAKNA
ncbi:DUF4280 domain-containing protein [Flavobacterium sp. LS1R49]|uniref:DUF4280 domain-containing protein n=1 Tax=Flavobacterium shii TaxID=2987687 RepID=A0A9X2ZJY9_9FLAO|nr:PAAR-like protein [Flavobacterium shii]MCV9930141.1 DUF4280 domain-containing protein [Flavobacterium shii]